MIGLSIMARKLGMSQIYDDSGERVSVTVLKAGPCVVVDRRTADENQYQAIQVGFEEVPAKVIKSKPVVGHFKKKSTPCFRVLKEFRVPDSSMYEIGQELKADFIEPGDQVMVTGVSKGKGFQGVMRRHHFGGHPASHGQTIHRRPGAIGMREFPGRVFKNKRMAGHLGDERVSILNLPVAGVDRELGLILVNGSVPGGKRALVTVKLTAKAKPKAEKKAE